MKLVNKNDIFHNRNEKSKRLLHVSAWILRLNECHMSGFLIEKEEFFFPNFTYGTQSKSDGDKNTTKSWTISLCSLLGH